LPQALFTIPADAPFVELQSVDSTNNYARQLIHAAALPDRQGMAQHGMAVFSHTQVAGKGQWGKTWDSEKGANIALSILIKPEGISINNQFYLSACAAVAVHGFFSKYAGDETKIKWPNDLYWQDRKAGGILIESVVQSSESGGGVWQWAIVGIGININQTNFEGLPNPVSLKQITGKTFEPLVLAKELCTGFYKHYNELITDGFENILSRYNSFLYKRNEKVRLKKDNRVFEAVVKKVSPAGKLVVQHSIEEEIDFGEVEWIIKP
jgi:BirA family transcriptional regulator, biotin operon repressor / biotin---[acetyl-CoA-carboxylase] ligase